MKGIGDIAYNLLIELIIWLLLFLAPIKILMAVVLGLISVDLFFGIWASVFSKKEAFSSRVLRRSIGKIVIYEIFMVLAMVLQKFVWPEHELIKGTISFISIIEGISILEHFKTITGIDVFGFIFHKINLTPQSSKYLFKLKNKSRKRNKR